PEVGGDPVAERLPARAVQLRDVVPVVVVQVGEVAPDVERRAAAVVEGGEGADVLTDRGAETAPARAVPLPDITNVLRVPPVACRVESGAVAVVEDGERADEFRGRPADQVRPA